MKKLSLLITNDDGIHAPGLKHLWLSLKDHYDVYIVAPAKEQSGMATAVTLSYPLEIEPVLWEEGTCAWQVTGTPADCVRMGTRILLKNKPDFIVSGINRGSNSGRNVLFSGTVGGVIEGAMRNIPGIAFSCEDMEHPNYEFFTKQVPLLVRYSLQNPLPNGSFLNVTFPSRYKSDHKGCYLARQGMSFYRENPLKALHPEGKESYWMGGRHEEHDEHEDSDVFLLKQGYITVVPIHVKELTDLAIFHERKSDFNTLFQLG